MLINIGTCARHLERDGEAIEMYEKFLALGQDQQGKHAISVAERKEVEGYISTLRTSLVTVLLTTNRPGATASISATVAP